MDDRYLAKAIDYATRSAYRFRHASVIVDRKTGKIIAIGVNRNIFYHDRTRSIHSEMDALMKLKKGRSLKHLVMYNVSLGYHERVRISAPCERCQKILNRIGFPRVYFSV